MNSISVTLTITEPKKHSVRYDTQDPEAALRTVYISKKKLAQPYPKEVEITITPK